MEALTPIMANQSGRFVEALLWVAGLFVFSLAGGMLLYWLKRRMDQSSHEEDGRLNAELIYRLRDEGQITDEEFHRLQRFVAGVSETAPGKDENRLRNDSRQDDGNRDNADTGGESTRPSQEQE